MRCDHADDILNGHAYADLAPPARVELEHHLNDCPRCAPAWRAHEAVAAVSGDNGDPALFDRIVGRLGDVAPPVSTLPAPRWVPHVGLAALVAIVALTVVVVERPTVPSFDDVGASADAGSDAPPVRIDTVDARFFEGRHYRRLPVTARVATGGTDVEVVEMFMYACFPCFAFEPHLQAWSESRAEEIRLERVPVTWGPLAELHARAFYTAEVLGQSERIHTAFFSALHEIGNPLDTEEAVADFFEGLGVDRATFARVFGSSDIDERIARADELAQRFGINGTPSLVVDGTYVTGGEMAGSYETLVEVVDELVSESATCHRFEAPASCRL